MLVQLLAMDVIILAVALWRRWQELALLALAQTAVIVCPCFGRVADWPIMTDAFAWTCFAVFAAYATVGCHLKRLAEEVGTGIVVAAMVLLGVLWGQLDQGPWALLWQVLALNATVLGASLWRRWQIVPPLALAQTAILVGACFGRLASWPVLTDCFAWAFFAEFTGYALVACRFKRVAEDLAVVLMLAGMVLMGSLWWQVDLGGPALLGQMLAMTVVMLAASLWRSWPIIAPLVLAQTAIVMAGCFGRFAHDDGRTFADVAGWLQAACFAGFGVTAWRLGRGRVEMAVAMVAAPLRCLCSCGCGCGNRRAIVSGRWWSRALRTGRGGVGGLFVGEVAVAAAWSRHVDVGWAAPALFLAAEPYGRRREQRRWRARNFSGPDGYGRSSRFSPPTF